MTSFWQNLFEPMGQPGMNWPGDADSYDIATSASKEAHKAARTVEELTETLQD